MLLFILFLVSVSLCDQGPSSNKRVIDASSESARIPSRPISLKGGALDSNCATLGRLTGQNVCQDEEENETMLLQVASLPEKFHFFEDYVPKGFINRSGLPLCTPVKRINEQGECNSCWAFALVAQVSYRLCKEARDLGLSFQVRKHQLPPAFSPYPLICGVNKHSNDNQSLCDPQPIDAPFTWVRENQLADYWHYVFSRDSNWDDFDPSNPSPKVCARLNDLNSKTFTFQPVRPISIRALHGQNNMKLFLVNQGPLVSIMRLTAEFADFRGSLFTSRDRKFHFLGQDTEDQDAAANEDEWLNHFVVIVGYGKTDNINYWLCENSWGIIYDSGDLRKDVYVVSVDNPEKKSSFLKIDNAIAGRGGLEVTNRISVYVRDFQVKDKETGNFVPLSSLKK